MNINFWRERSHWNLTPTLFSWTGQTITEFTHAQHSPDVGVRRPSSSLSFLGAVHWWILILSSNVLKNSACVCVRTNKKEKIKTGIMALFIDKRAPSFILHKWKTCRHCCSSQIVIPTTLIFLWIAILSTINSLLSRNLGKPWRLMRGLTYQEYSSKSPS